MSSDEETGYGSIETPKVESTTSRRRGVAVVAALALFGLVVADRSGVVYYSILTNVQADKPSPGTVALSSKTETALIKMGIGYSHKPRLCEDGSYSRGCRPGLTEPPTDAPTPKPVVEIVDEAEPGFFGRLFGPWGRLFREHESYGPI